MLALIHTDNSNKWIKGLENSLSLEGIVKLVKLLCFPFYYV